LDVTDETNKPCFSVAGKEYNKKACCEVGQNVPSDSCPAGSSALIIVISVLAPIIGALMMGVFLFLLCKKKKHETMVNVPEAVPVQESGINMINPSKNASMEQYHGATAPPPPFNPESSVQASVRVY
jgi:hypothetical protein